MELKFKYLVQKQLVTHPCLEPCQYNTHRHATRCDVYCYITLASNSVFRSLLSASSFSTERSLDIYRLPNFTHMLTPPFLPLTLSKFGSYFLFRTSPIPPVVSFLKMEVVGYFETPVHCHHSKCCHNLPASKTVVLQSFLSVKYFPF